MLFDLAWLWAKILHLIGFLCGIDHDSHEAFYGGFLLLIQALPKAAEADVDVFMLPCHFFSIVPAPPTISVRILWNLREEKEHEKPTRAANLSVKWSNKAFLTKRTVKLNVDHFITAVLLWSASIFLILSLIIKWSKGCKCALLIKAELVELLSAHKYQQRGKH